MTNDTGRTVDKTGDEPVAALPPTEIELWGHNAEIYISGTASERGARERVCRSWTDANFMTVVGVCHDPETACTLPAMHRPGLLRALEDLEFRDADVLVVSDADFNGFSASEAYWLRNLVRTRGKRLEVVPVQSEPKR